ncbi:helix-turn-helix transcriptional regulator [Chryseobacterium gossypii]|uniref:helix-turn-helix transcriptional regulator n=1 Tax=Chryseobacterium gossypii TaxID=3231602 RepID=UPI003525180E
MKNLLNFVLRYLIICFFFTSCNESKSNFKSNFDDKLFFQNENLIFNTQFDQVILFNKKYYRLADKRRYWGGKAMTLLNLLFNYTRGGSLQKTFKFLNKSLKVENNFLANFMSAMNHIENNDYDSARVYINNTSNLVARNKNIYFTFLLNCEKGYFFYLTNDYNNSEIFFKQSIKDYYSGKSKFFTLDLYRPYEGLIQIYKMAGQKKDEVFYKNELEKVNLSTIEHNKKLNNTTYDFIYEINNITKKEKKLKYSILILGLLCMSFFGFSFFISNFKSKPDYIPVHLTNEQTVEVIRNMNYREKLDEVINLIKKNNPIYVVKYKEIDPLFINNLTKKYPTIEESEIAFCIMLKLRFSSKEIADFTCVQHKSVQQKKYRLRKKLNIPKDIDLYKFFDNI